MNIYILYTLLSGMITFFISVLGSLMVFFIKKENTKIVNVLLLFSTGLMISASFFSLLLPAINSYKNINDILLGFILGCLLILIIDIIFSKNNILSVILGITFHNIPEGLAIGIAFGNALYNPLLISNAIILSLGIGLQNFPEGLAISIPLYKKGYSKAKSFLFGILTSIVEPISALVGVILIMKVSNIMPFFLSFASGAMFYVIFSELLPECNLKEKNSAIFMMIGFILMLFLEIIFN